MAEMTGNSWRRNRFRAIITLSGLGSTVMDNKENFKDKHGKLTLNASPTLFDNIVTSVFDPLTKLALLTTEGANSEGSVHLGAFLPVDPPWYASTSQGGSGNVALFFAGVSKNFMGTYYYGEPMKWGNGHGACSTCDYGSPPSVQPSQPIQPCFWWA